MPAHNVEKFIAASIESVIAQTYAAWQLIIVDDGSTDGTGEIASGYAGKDPRILYRWQENKGAAASRNQGLSLAAGNLVSFLDGDDLWHPSFLAKVIASWEKTGADLVFSGHDRLRLDGQREIYRNELYDEAGSVAGNIFASVIAGKLWIHIGALLVTRELLHSKGIQFTDGCLMWEDVEFEYKLLAVANVAYVPEALVTYRERPGSTTQQQWTWHTYIHSVYALERVLGFVKAAFPDGQNEPAIAITQRYTDFVRYRFLYRMVKTSDHPALLKVLEDNGWDQAVRRITAKEYGPISTIKAWIVTSRRPDVWRATAFIGSLLASFRFKQRLRAIR